MSATYEPSLILPSLPAEATIQPIQKDETTYEISFSLPGTSLALETHSFSLGPLGKCVNASIRLTREKVYWLMPSIDSKLPSHVDTQVLLLNFRKENEDEDGVAAILPLTTEEYMGTLRGSDAGSEDVYVRFESDLVNANPGRKAGKVIIAFASNVRDAMRKAVDGVRNVLGLGTTVDDLDSEKQIFSETLTYCTWNSLHPPTPPTQTSVFRTLSHFASLSPPIHPTSLLLDDAWQHVHPETARLLSFTALPKFLDGLKDLEEVVKVAKEEYGVVRVGVWHTMQGYWRGVEPAAFGKKYKLVKVVKDGYHGPAEPEGFAYYIPHPTSVASFFHDYYAYIASCGVEFTKCDNMGALDNLRSAHEVEFTFNEDGTWSETLGNTVNVASIRPAFKKAVQAAAKAAFGSGETGDEAGRTIWCMEMTPRVLMGKEIGLRQGRKRCVVRNSDDYYPDQPDSHRYHIFTNVVNALFTSQLNVIPDLDMFQSHPYIAPSETQPKPQAPSGKDIAQASYHAALRAFGAGPVTITDVPGHTDSSVLSKLLGYPLAKDKKARSIALQASSSPWVDNSIFDRDLVGSGSGKALRVFSKSPFEMGSGAEAGMIGYWNIRSEDGKVEDRVASQDVRQIVGHAPHERKYILRSYRLGTNFSVIIEASSDNGKHVPFALPEIRVRLEPFEFDIITITPVVDGIAQLGLVDKYNALCGLRSVGWRESGKTKVDYKCCGVAGIFVEGGTSTQAVGEERVIGNVAGVVKTVVIGADAETLEVEFRV